MKTNKAFRVAGINNLLKTNYHIDPQTVDVFSYVDETLTFGENWTEIKEMVSCHSIPYEYLKCKNCNYQKRTQWKFCPMCASSLEEQNGE